MPHMCAPSEWPTHVISSVAAPLYVKYAYTFGRKMSIYNEFCKKKKCFTRRVHTQDGRPCNVGCIDIRSPHKSTQNHFEFHFRVGEPMRFHFRTLCSIKGQTKMKSVTEIIKYVYASVHALPDAQRGLPACVCASFHIWRWVRCMEWRFINSISGQWHTHAGR